MPHNSERLSDLIFGNKRAEFRISIEKSKEIAEKARAEGLFSHRSSTEAFLHSERV